MQNMIQLVDGRDTYKVFFDLNRQTQDFDNISVWRDGASITVYGRALERLKDSIAVEWNLSMMELGSIYKNGHAPTMM